MERGCMAGTSDLHSEQIITSTTASVENVEGELRAFIRRDVSLHRSRRDNGDANADIGSPVERMAAASIHEIERVMAELANVREVLSNEATRVQRDLNNYAATSRDAISSMKVIGDSLLKWKSQTPELPQGGQLAENSGLSQNSNE
jgi:hypothetical protein